MNLLEPEVLAAIKRTAEADAAYRNARAVEEYVRAMAQFNENQERVYGATNPVNPEPLPVPKNAYETDEDTSIQTGYFVVVLSPNPVCAPLPVWQPPAPPPAGVAKVGRFMPGNYGIDYYAALPGDTVPLGAKVTYQGKTLVKIGNPWGQLYQVA